MRQYPIYTKVTACNYNSSKNWGSKECCSFTQFVGSSQSNSHLQCKFITTKRFFEEYKGFRNVFVFKTSLDEVILKINVFSSKNGGPNELIKTFNKLNKIKSL